MAVTAPTQTTWATAADVQALTGQEVTDFQVDIANMIIESLAKRVYTVAAERTGSRDIEWMKRAVAFECVWLTGQPDFFTRLDINAFTEGRRTIMLEKGGLLLAPMAKMALRNVSWLRTRSIHVRSAWEDGMSPVSPDPDSAANDVYEQWSPMGGG
jgi:hypothetical protein